MASESENLRLATEITDKFSKPLSESQAIAALDQRR
jgi:hypothetical protein